MILFRYRKLINAGNGHYHQPSSQQFNALVMKTVNHAMFAFWRRYRYLLLWNPIL